MNDNGTQKISYYSGAAWDAVDCAEFGLIVPFCLTGTTGLFSTSERSRVSGKPNCGKTTTTTCWVFTRPGKMLDLDDLFISTYVCIINTFWNQTSKLYGWALNLQKVNYYKVLHGFNLLKRLSQYLAVFIMANSTTIRIVNWTCVMVR